MHEVALHGLRRHFIGEEKCRPVLQGLMLSYFSLTSIVILVLLTVLLLVLPLVLPPLPPPPLILLFVPVLLIIALVFLALLPSELPNVLSVASV